LTFFQNEKENGEYVDELSPISILVPAFSFRNGIQIIPPGFYGFILNINAD